MSAPTRFHQPAVRPSQPHPARPPQPVRPRRRWLPYALAGGFGMVLLLALACVFAVVLAFVSADRIPERVTVAGVNIGGESAQKAEMRLEQVFADKTIQLTGGERTQTLSLTDLGISVDLEATLAAAQQAVPGQAVNPAYEVDLGQAQTALVTLSQVVNVEPLGGDAPRNGRSIDIPVLLDRLRVDAAGELADGVLDLPMITLAPPEPETVTAANYSGATTTHIVEAGQELGLIAKQYNVAIADLVSLNGISNPDLLYVGQELTIPASGEYVPSEADAPPPSTSAGKAIVVSLGTQRIYAFENGKLVHSHLVSTGLPQTPTVQGDYSIYVKYLADDMSGPGYFLPQVPYTMYFYSGYAIHGTYWHNAFGRAMSHGCVNLPVGESEWFFNWASVGTPVRVVA